ncbi:TM206 protein, partial [Polypterus senegalus]
MAATLRSRKRIPALASCDGCLKFCHTASGVHSFRTLTPLRLSNDGGRRPLSEEAERVAATERELLDNLEELDSVCGDGSALPAEDDEGGSSNPSLRFSKACLKNVFSVILIFIYLLLMAVAVFLAYQTITDFMDKLKHPVMSVTYKEVDRFDAPGIALYLGKAELLSCKHHYHDHIPPLENPGQQGAVECHTEQINYTDPFTNHTTKLALIVRGPREVRKRELIFLQFLQNKTEEDFSAISYLLFSSFQDFLLSQDKAQFMKNCESSYSIWTFSGGFRTWVKMSLVKTMEKDGSKSVEFRQEIITANAWNTIAILCGVFLALFKAADFAKLSIKWMIKVRKRQLKRKTQEMNHIG